MENKFKKGDKVVPKIKTKGFGDLKASNIWNSKQAQSQGFLYVTDYNESGKYYRCSFEIDNTNDYFAESDLELYEEPKVIVVNPTVKREEGFQIATTQKSEYLKFHEQVCQELIKITAKKNADYTGSNDNPFANFTSVENGICSTEQGFLVRMNDKFERIKSFVSQGDLQVKEESVSDTLMDLGNYCILFMGYLNQKKQNNK